MSNDIHEQKRLHALNTPHNLFAVDKMLKTKADSQQLQITLGWEAPNETYNPSATLLMSVDFAKALAQELLRATESLAATPSGKTATRRTLMRRS